MTAILCNCGRPIVTDMPALKIPCLECQATKKRLAERRERLFAEEPQPATCHRMVSVEGGA